MSKPKNTTGVRFNRNGKVTTNDGVLLGTCRMIAFEPTTWLFIRNDGQRFTRRIRADLIPFAQAATTKED